jgi:hypothetical protein
MSALRSHQVPRGQLWPLLLVSNYLRFFRPWLTLSQARRRPHHLRRSLPKLLRDPQRGWIWCP